MYSYNSYHKVLTVGIVFLWAIFQFGGSIEDDLVYDNDQIKRSGVLLNNLKQGTWTWYYSNGKTELTGKYEKGKRVGIWKNFNSNGVLTLERTYSANKLNGRYTKYNEDGSISHQEIYKDDIKQKSP